MVRAGIAYRAITGVAGAALLSFGLFTTLPGSPADGGADTASAQSSAHPAAVSSLATSDLVEFTQLPPAVQRLLASGLALTHENLTYTYGSDDPRNGGMDCSGTISYLLRQSGLHDVPRDSSELYLWAWKAGHLDPVVSVNTDSFELSRLRPGDLLFWSGTYKIDRDPPITHVMIYLGTSRLTGRRVMVGASDGRTFNGQPRWGVSVFDFNAGGGSKSLAVSTTHSSSRFVGYSPVPGIEDSFISPSISTRHE